jgi:hypothetical protein
LDADPRCAFGVGEAFTFIVSAAEGPYVAPLEVSLVLSTAFELPLDELLPQFELPDDPLDEPIGVALNEGPELVPDVESPVVPLDVPISLVLLPAPEPVILESLDVPELVEPEIEESVPVLDEPVPDVCAPAVTARAESINGQSRVNRRWVFLRIISKTSMVIKTAATRVGE